MAVFLINTCKFKGCGLTFATLSELIQHIEETHIDTDPSVIEKQEQQQPPSLALSYVFRVFTEGSKRERPRPRPSSVSPVSSMRSLTPTGSELDEDEHLLNSCDEENSDDSWTTQEEISSDFILSMVSNRPKDEGLHADTDKPFACPIPGCKKRYKNINGMKYHAKHAHKKEVRVKKPFKCKCQKSYKSAPGLRHHIVVHHSSNKKESKSQAPAGLLWSQSPAHLLALNRKLTGLTSIATPAISTLPHSQAIAHSQANLSSLSATALPQTVLAPPVITTPVAMATMSPAPTIMTVPVTMTSIAGKGSMAVPHISEMLKLPVTQLVINNGIPISTGEGMEITLAPSSLLHTHKKQAQLSKCSPLTTMTLNHLPSHAVQYSTGIEQPIRFVPEALGEVADNLVSMETIISDLSVEDYSSLAAGLNPMDTMMDNVVMAADRNHSENWTADMLEDAARSSDTENKASLTRALFIGNKFNPKARVAGLDVKLTPPLADDVMMPSDRLVE